MLLSQLPKIAGALVILDVIAVYAYSLRINGRHPPSNPWSGIALVLLAVILLRPYLQRNPVAVPRRVSREIAVAAVAAAVAASLWTVSAIVP